MSGRLPFTGRVTGNWIDRGVWLVEAAIQFAAPERKAQIEAASAAYARHLGIDTSAVLRWLMRSNAADLDEDALAGMDERARRDLIHSFNLKGTLAIAMQNQLQQGALVAFGERGRIGGDLEWIPAVAWYLLVPDTGIANAVTGGGNEYYFVRVVDPGSSPPYGAERSTKRGVARTDHTETDQPLVMEMERLLTMTPPLARNPWDAALALSCKAAGGGTPDSKAKRLLKRYKKQYSDVSSS